MITTKNNVIAIGDASIQFKYMVENSSAIYLFGSPVPAFTDGGILLSDGAAVINPSSRIVGPFIDLQTAAMRELYQGTVEFAPVEPMRRFFSKPQAVAAASKTHATTCFIADKPAKKANIATLAHVPTKDPMTIPLEVAAGKTADCNTSFFSLNELSECTEEGIAHPHLTIEKTGGGTLNMNGNNSWFDGVFDVRKGRVNIPAGGKIPGGKINLRTGTTMEIDGGPKDSDNIPDIIMERANLIFKLATSGENRIFSFYGTITSDLLSTIYFASGLTYIKGDCSGFTGMLDIADGAEVIVRTDGQHNGALGGKMRTCSVGNITLKSNCGLSPIDFQRGTLQIKPDLESQNQCGDIERLSVRNEAKAIISVPDAVLYNTLIQGEMDIADGKSVTFHDLTIDGGELKITSQNLECLYIKDSFNIGSTLNTMNGRIDYIGPQNIPGQWAVDPDETMLAVDIDTTINVTPGHDFGLKLDLHPVNGNCDQIIARNCNFAEGSFLAIKDYDLLSSPVNPSHDFRILYLTDANPNYLPIRIDTDKFFIIRNSYYKLFESAAPGFITLKTFLPNFNKEMDLEDILKLLPEDQKNDLVNNYLPIQETFEASIDNITNMLTTIPSPDFKTKTYRIWTKLLCSGVTHHTGMGETKLSEKGMLVGFDFSHIDLPKGFGLTPTIFGNFSKTTGKYENKNTHQKKYSAGAKLSIYNGSNILDVILSYHNLKTNRPGSAASRNAKSNIFGSSMRYAHLFSLTNELQLRPEVTINALNISKEKYSNKELPTRVDKHASLTLTAALQVMFEHNDKHYSLAFKCHNNLNKMPNTYINDIKLNKHRRKNRYFECKLDATIPLAYGLHLVPELTKFFGSKKGFAISLGAHKNF